MNNTRNCPECGSTMAYKEDQTINVKFKTPVGDLIDTIGNEGFGHHWMVAFDDYKDIFIEICKMLQIYCINID